MSFIKIFYIIYIETKKKEGNIMKIEDMLRAELLKGKSVDTILDEMKDILITENENKIRNDKQKELIKTASSNLVDAYINYLKAKEVDISDIENEEHKNHLIKFLTNLEISYDKNIKNIKNIKDIKYLDDIFDFFNFW